MNSSFMMQKISKKFWWDHPNRGVKCPSGKQNFLDWSRSLQLRRLTAENLYPSSIVRQCASEGILFLHQRTVGDNNFGDDWSLMITGMVQLTSTRLVLWKSVDYTHHAGSQMKRGSCWKCSSGWHRVFVCIITGPPNGPILFCMLSSDVTRRRLSLSSVVVTCVADPAGQYGYVPLGRQLVCTKIGQHFNWHRASCVSLSDSWASGQHC